MVTADDQLLTSTFYFSCRQTRSGRMIRTVKASKSRELWDHVRKNGQAIVTGVDFDAYVSTLNAAPDIVSFRMDTQAWLDSLTNHQRQRALDLADGSSTKELAERWGVSPEAFRRQLNQSYERFRNG